MAKLVRDVILVQNEDHICDLCGEGGLEWVQIEITTEHNWSLCLICVACSVKISQTIQELVK